MVKICLKEALKEHNMQQKDLCEKIHARPSTISNLCNGMAISIKLKLLEDICMVLDCSPSDIIKII